jgi:AraC-like DNA-binding protein
MDHIDFYSFDLQPHGGIAVNRDTYTEPGIVAFDVHFELEIGIVLKGAVSRIVDGLARRINSGELWVHSSWEPHGLAVIEAPCEIIDIVIDPLVLLKQETFDWLLPFQLPLEKRLPGRVLTPEGAMDLRELAERLLRTFIARAPLYEAWIRHWTNEIILSLYDSTSVSQQLQGTQNRLASYGAVRPALRAATDHIHTGIRANQAAAACGMSERAFRRAFREATGSSFREFSERVRLGALIHALQGRDEPIKKIAERYGFTDVSHLNHWLKKRTGMTPATLQRLPAHEARVISYR